MASDAEQIRAEMISDSRVPVDQQQSDKRIFRILTCINEELIQGVIVTLIQFYLGEDFVIEVTEKWRKDEIIGCLKAQPIDLIVPFVNNMWVGRYAGEDYMQNVVDFLISLKVKYQLPILAISGYNPPSFDLPERLKQGGIDAFLWSPVELDPFYAALKKCGIVSKS